MGALNRLGISSAAAVPSSALRRFAAGSTRRYGSAAAAVQYDSGYEEDYYYSNRMELGRDAAAAEGTTTWGRGVQWVLIGDPGARKHVYAEKLSKLLEVPHISMGTLLRQELNPNSSLYKQMANAVNDGKLVPEDVIFGLLSRRLEEGYSRGENGFILDGIPRTRLQAEILDQIADIDLVVNFKCKENTDCLVKRTFSSVEKPKYEVADAGSMWNEKFRVDAEQGKALEDYYRRQRKLVDFQVAGAPGETWKGLLAALRLQHIGAANSSPKLAALRLQHIGAANSSPKLVA